MSFIKKHKLKILISAVVVILLIFMTFFVKRIISESFVNIEAWENKQDSSQTARLIEEMFDEEQREADYSDPDIKVEEKETDNHEEKDAVPKEYAENYYEQDVVVTEDEKQPVNPENLSESTEMGTDENKENELHCTLEVKCDTILNSLEMLDKEKRELVPKDGIIFKKQEVVFNDGESVFDILVRELKKAKIHLEFVKTPVYNNAYIEGIHNIYEFDCGELSGWMYSVNGWFPNFGCSQYMVKDGDTVEWRYTCDMGKDIGGEYSSGKQR